MDELGHGHHHGSSHGARRSYWKRAHHDWRFWVAVFFIFAAILVYVMSDDLALVPMGHPRHSSTMTNGSL